MLHRWLKVLGIACAAAALSLTGCAKHVELHGTTLYTPAPDLPLHDVRGQAFSYHELQGTVAIVFFGYTHCPDVCPTTLSRIAQALHKMSPLERNRVKVYFVSVDPARDTLPLAQRYVALFDPSFIALGGTTDQLNHAEKNYHVWAQRMPPKPGSKDYEMAHSSAVFVSDGSGNIAELLDWDASSAEFGADLEALSGATR